MKLKNLFFGQGKFVHMDRFLLRERKYAKPENKQQCVMFCDRHMGDDIK